MKDLISIIVPFLNSEKTLDKCIKSILNQTVDNYEIILIDNSSTDKSKNIATSYSKKYNFIKYYNIKKRSVSAARNKGLSEAKGNLICFVDSDDYISEKYLEIMHRELMNNDLVICNFTSNNSKVNDKIETAKEKADNLKKMNKNVPVYFIAGGDDPVGDYGSGVYKAAEQFRNSGMATVDSRVFPLCRHEILNEINRDEVYQSVGEWLQNMNP